MTFSVARAKRIRVERCVIGDRRLFERKRNKTRYKRTKSLVCAKYRVNCGIKSPVPKPRPKPPTEK